MARNLAAAGHRVKAWNRLGGTIKGVTMVSSPVDALQGDAALTMLAEDAAIRAVLLQPGVLDHAKAGVVHIVAQGSAPSTRGGRTGRPHSANARCGTWPHD
jgi:3-hydroxyisobutyrate dehydrogenase-like beta-hydroxyacid dehydrogenase